VRSAACRAPFIIGHVHDFLHFEHCVHSSLVYRSIGCLQSLDDNHGREHCSDEVDDERQWQAERQSTRRRQPEDR
jgi:hypothetical protein